MLDGLLLGLLGLGLLAGIVIDRGTGAPGTAPVVPPSIRYDLQPAFITHARGAHGAAAALRHLRPARPLRYRIGVRRGRIGMQLVNTRGPGVNMDVAHAGAGGGRVAQSPQAGASARLVLGARLRRLREAAGVSPEDAARAIRASRSKISRLEHGRTGFKSRDVADLLALYGVSDDAERATMLALAGHANAGSWWQEYADVVPAWLEHYLDLEPAASLIRTYEVAYIPGLLQTGDYARAVLRSGHPDAPDAEIERRAELRLRRQQVLHRDDPVRLWAVIDETALRRPVGGTAVIRAQIAHLIEASRLSHVNIQVLPLSAGGHAAGGGCVTMLRFSESEVPDVVYLEQLLTAVYLSRPGDSACYRDVLDRLATQAEDLGASAATLERILGTRT